MAYNSFLPDLEFDPHFLHVINVHLEECFLVFLDMVLWRSSITPLLHPELLATWRYEASLLRLAVFLDPFEKVVEFQPARLFDGKGQNKVFVFILVFIIVFILVFVCVHVVLRVELDVGRQVFLVHGSALPPLILVEHGIQLGAVKLLGLMNVGEVLTRPKVVKGVEDILLEKHFLFLQSVDKVLGIQRGWMSRKGRPRKQQFDFSQIQQVITGTYVSQFLLLDCIVHMTLISHPLTMPITILMPPIEMVPLLVSDFEFEVNFKRHRQ